ncbi:MAG: gliding motility-associated C-terminal domain-containing protein [Ferruginibacter sp.]
MKKLNNLFISTFVFVCLVCHLASTAQVCTGALGDPVVNIHFGSGSNPGSQLKAATTTYNFTSSICPNDGFYTVVNSTAGCFSNSWYSLTEDHTPGDANGYVMLVNASQIPGDFFVDTVKNLCANTTYEFAAWILNIVTTSACNGNAIQPKLVFNIETVSGTVLGTYSTGSIPTTSSTSWKQYGLFFTTPPNVNNVIIRLTNTAPGGCGNDIALDDITFRPCGPGVTAAVATTGQTAVDICKGVASNLSINATVGAGYISPIPQWQESLDNGVTWSDIPGAAMLTYQFNKTGNIIYKYRLSVAEGVNAAISSCRVYSNPVVITVHDIPSINAGSNSPVCEKQLIKLTATGGATYSWIGPAGFGSTLATPSFTAQSNSGGIYNVVVTDQFGCKNSASVTVVTNPNPQVTVSNTQPICEGNIVTLQAGGGTTYKWLPAMGLSDANIANPIASPADTTTYRVIVTSANSCSDTGTVVVNILKKPIANAGADKILFKGQKVVIDGSAGGTNVSFSWYPVSFLDDPLLMQPTAMPVSDTRYTLVVASNVGCGTATDEVFVKVFNGFYIPNAFSPNNDMLNDTWRIDVLAGVPGASVIVYNRFGGIIFQTTGNSQYWNGTYKGQPVPMGAYPYIIDLKNGMPLKKGMVMVVR